MIRPTSIKWKGGKKNYFYRGNNSHFKEDQKKLNTSLSNTTKILGINYK